MAAQTHVSHSTVRRHYSVISYTLLRQCGAGNVTVKPQVMRCGMRPPYTLVLEFIDLLKSYGSAEMTARVDAGSQFAKLSVTVWWRFFEYFDPAHDGWG